MPHHNSHYYEFGPYRLDVGQRVLTRTGEAVSLPPKATEILTLLVAKAGQLVGKDELLNQVWPDTFVEESNLTQNIFLLRRVLGDERPAPKYIETVVRRGYRFIANVRVIGGPGDIGGEVGPRDLAGLRDSLASDSRDSSSTSTGSGTHTANGDDASVPRTVAVLPFLNATGNPDIEYLADGLTDNLVNNLSRVSKLRVMSRTAVFRYKAKKELDARGVGRELGVGVVLVGKLTAGPAAHASELPAYSSKHSADAPNPSVDAAELSGDASTVSIAPAGLGASVSQVPARARSQSIGISVELVEVYTGWQLWGESFDCPLKDILEVQDSITRQLLSALKLKLTGDEEKRITARYTENAEAYQAYLQARYHWSKYTRAGIEKAIIHFRHAIEVDPNYALAYDGVIDCCLRLATRYFPPEDKLSVTAAEADQLQGAHIAYNDDVETSKVVRPMGETEARVKVRFEWDWKVAERELHRAQELRSDYPAAHQWYAAYRLAKSLVERSADGSHDGNSSDEWMLPAQILSGEPSIAEQLQVLCAVARGQIAVCNYEAAELILKPFY
ncbi:MAG TPA: winged helix-turn-helix domain-containing protein, partial [Pyrinomonadaceae bacterium]|nr:winged helix-turn-helix domain-containing protein [Pyrinomonadaceae bacterium]